MSKKKHELSDEDLRAIVLLVALVLSPLYYFGVVEDFFWDGFIIWAVVSAVVMILVERHRSKK